ncbi:MAG: radical SAM family heme chaperone HemW [Pseudomonadota bacterium]|nr:radical SAM family heme chaperone HemW [Pseudomonadota bacterium]
MKIETEKFFSVYIHWPFCEAKCPYCDFNSHVRQSINQRVWTQAYIKSLNYWKKVLPSGIISSIFFGGGTPSLMDERCVYDILNCINKLWTFDNEVEVTLEANPTSVETSRFRSYKKSGVNRVSLGIQALNDHDLKRLGRLHTASAGKNSINLALNWFDRVSFDLIYGRQYQKVKDWEDELKSAISFSTGHLSLYQLTIEKKTRFGELQSKGKLRGLPSDNCSAEFFNITREICEASDFENYEISNYALPGNECRHNLNYWNSGNFIGVGPGAHGRVQIGPQRFRCETPLNPETWFNNIEQEKHEEFCFLPLTKTENAEEYALMSIRLASGINLEKYNLFGGNRLRTKKIRSLEAQNLVTIDENSLKTTNKGKLFTDFVIQELLC